MKKYLKNTMILALGAFLALEGTIFSYASALTPGMEKQPVTTYDASTDGIALSGENFPDPVFCKYIRDNFDTNLNGILETDELSAVTKLDVSGKGIGSLSGIGYFTSLTELDCSYNRLDSLDLSGLDSLTLVTADHNAYARADMPDDSGITDSSSLSNVSGNAVQDAEILFPSYENTVLYSDGETAAALTSPAIFEDIALDRERFPDDHFYEYLCSYIDVDGDNILSARELSQTTVLQLSGLGISDLTGLSYFTNLVYLDCSDNQLEELSLDGLPYLLGLNCSDNFLPALSLDACPYLEELSCEDNIADVSAVSANCIDLSTLPLTDPDKMHFDGGALAEQISYYFDGNLLYMENLTDGTFLPYKYDIGFPSDAVFTLCVTLPDDIDNYAAVSGNTVSDNTLSVSDNSVSDNSVSDSDTTAPSFKDISPNMLSNGSNVSDGNVREADEALVIGVPAITRLTNPSTGKAALLFSGAQNATGYEVAYSSVNSFSTNVVTLDTQKTSVTVTNLPKNKTYYFKVRGYRDDKDGTRTYGAYCNAVSVKIQKGVKEVKYSATAGKFKSCKLTKQNTFCFKATVKQRIKSSDDFYYLCQVDPYTDKKVRVVAQVPKTTSISITLPAQSEDGTNLLEGKYALCIKSGGKYKLITKGGYIDNPQLAATYTAAFPNAATKKGIQGADGQSDLGVSHSLINIPLTDVISTDGTGVPYSYNGKTYYFKKDPYVGTIKRCNAAGITLSAVILLPWDEGLKSLITSKGRKPMAASYFALNTSQTTARETLEAAFMYLAELYSRENCHLDNWILGNEVNVPNPWNFAGSTSYNAYVENYAHAFRTLYYAVVSHNKNARVYISLDHNWTGSGSAYGSRDFMVNFNSALKAQNKNIKWNLAYHAYPVPLTSPAFWNNTLATNNPDSHYVTLKNISVLTKFVKKKFGSKTRIILSEQGFTSTNGEAVQAAALAYGYYISEFNSMIDAFIIRSDIDNSVESAQGLKMGLRNIDGSEKAAYKVFKYMDTPDYAAYTNTYLKIIGKSSWKQAVPGFKASKLKKMPKRSN